MKESGCRGLENAARSIQTEFRSRFFPPSFSAFLSALPALLLTLPPVRSCRGFARLPWTAAGRKGLGWGLVPPDPWCLRPDGPGEVRSGRLGRWARHGLWPAVHVGGALVIGAFAATPPRAAIAFRQVIGSAQ